MKKKIIPAALIFLAVIACTLFVSDGWIYLIASLMSLTIMGAIWRNKSKVMKMTRWAKANPKKSQVIISVLQIVLMVLGILAGNNFKELGYEFSGTTAFIFGTILVLGFLSVHFLPKQRTIAIPKLVNRNRLAYVGIALSSFVLMILFGNRMGDMYPNSPLTHAVKAIDHAIFPDNSAAFADFDDEASEPDFRNNYETVSSDKASSAMVVFASFSNSGKETIEPSTILKKETRAIRETDFTPIKIHSSSVSL